ncbi:MAG: 6-phosphogluconolactonase [Pelagimonas sp.]|nr:6-phosphogluconolactonase [Pelagimonas sp.]
MSYDLIKYPDRDMLAMDLASQLADDLEEALHHEDRVCFAVPGGTSPGPVFDTLSAVDLDWGRVDIILTDERWVPEDHARSNTRLIRERLLVGRAAKARLLPLYAPRPAPDGVLAELEVNIKPALPLDVVLLGMGADMHTASLFPEADKLDQALWPDAPILMPMRAPGAPEPRITLTGPVLDGALRKHILIYGDEKKQALDGARGKSSHIAPINAVLTGAKVHWAA